MHNNSTRTLAWPWIEQNPNWYHGERLCLPFYVKMAAMRNVCCARSLTSTTQYLIELSDRWRHSTHLCFSCFDKIKMSAVKKGQLGKTPSVRTRCSLRSKKLATVVLTTLSSLGSEMFPNLRVSHLQSITRCISYLSHTLTFKRRHETFSLLQTKKIHPWAINPCSTWLDLRCLALIWSVAYCWDAIHSFFVWKIWIYRCNEQYNVFKT